MRRLLRRILREVEHWWLTRQLDAADRRNWKRGLTAAAGRVFVFADNPARDWLDQRRQMFGAIGRRNMRRGFGSAAWMIASWGAMTYGYRSGNDILFWMAFLSLLASYLYVAVYVMQFVGDVIALWRGPDQPDGRGPLILG